MNCKAFATIQNYVFHIVLYLLLGNVLVLHRMASVALYCYVLYFTAL